MDWSKQRKIIYGLIFLGVIIILTAYPIFKFLNPPQTCFDQKKNGEERGVDCDGACALQCLIDIKQPNILWSKAFPLINGEYDLGAYVENVNSDAGIKNARYVFRVFDNAGVLLAEKNGSTELAPASGVLLFESGIAISGNPDHTELVFEKDDLITWIKAQISSSMVITKNQVLKNADTNPRLNVTIANIDQVNDIRNLVFGAVIYDAQRNPIAVSRTFVDLIQKSSEHNVSFTWPNRFTKNSKGQMCTNPVDTILVFDRSGSMDIGQKNPAEPLTTAKNAAMSYIDAAGVSDKLGLISFSGTISSPIDHTLSIDHTSVAQALASVSIGKVGLQYTNLGDALKGAISEFESERHVDTAKKIIVALTDGIANRPLGPEDLGKKIKKSKNQKINESNKSDSKFAQEYAASIALGSRTKGIEIFAIGLGDEIDEPFLRDHIATNPEQYFNAPTAESLQAVYKTISEAVCKSENFIIEIIVTPQAIFEEGI